MLYKTLSINKAEVEQGPDGPVVRGVITAETVDREGEVVVSQGMDTTGYDENPVLLYNHDTKEPIGNITSLTRGKGKIEATMRFAQRPANFEGPFFASYIESLVLQGVVRGISIGFLPKEDGVRKANDHDREVYGKNCRAVYSKWDLMEVSIAPLPANPSALVTAVSKGLISREAATRFGHLSRRPTLKVSVPAVGRLSRL